MPTRLRQAELGTADARRLGADLSAELRDARLAAGISQAAAAHAAGMSAAQWGRLERGELVRPDILQLCRAGRALGLKASIRLYPVGAPVRDAAQLALLERFEAVLGAPLRLRREVALPLEGDLRAWDGCVQGDGEPFFIEGESHVRDAQAVERRIRLKRRDDPRATTVLLVLTRSDHHRRLLRDHREAFRDLLPLNAPAVLRSLQRGRRPAASGIVLI